MLKHPKNVYHQRCSTSDFLCNQANTLMSDQQTGQNGLNALEELNTVFPDLMTGQAIIEYADEHLAAVATFTAMIIRVDTTGSPLSEAAVTHPDSKLLIDIARSIDTICQPVNGIWGQLNRITFAAYLPGTAPGECEKIAGHIQDHIRQHWRQSVSIGIATYPTIRFNKEHILENAGKALDHATFFGPDSAVIFDAISLNISGDKLYQNGDINAAIEEYKTALQIDPANVNVHNSLGVCYGVLNDLDQALMEFEEGIRLAPEEVMPVYNAGLIHMLKKNKTQALEYYFRAEQMGEDIFEIKFQIGRLYLETGRPEKALAYLSRASELKSESAPVCRYLGECYLTMEQMGEAISAYKKAVKINPNDSDSLSALGYLFDIQDENIDIATMFCEKSIELSPSNGLFRYRLGRLYLKQNRPEQAIAEFRAASELGHDAGDDIRKIEENPDTPCPGIN